MLSKLNKLLELNVFNKSIFSETQSLVNWQQSMGWDVGGLFNS